MNFEAVQKHCMEIYESALVWIPKNSLIRKTYIADVSRVPKVIVGLSDSWGPAELIIQNGSMVQSVAFSQDGSRVVSGSDDRTVRIWNVTTGEVEAELKGHTNSVRSVAFSQDGSQVVSGSLDKTVRIWNLTMGNSQSMNTSEVTLPDGSRVKKITPYKFCIYYPSQRSTLSVNSTLRISDDSEWIMASLRHCWIPSQYRNISCSSTWGNQICLGYQSGLVVIFDMTAAL